MLGAVLAAVPAMAQSVPPADAPKPRVGDSFDVAESFLGVKCEHWTLRDLNRGGYLVWQCEDKLVYLAADHGFALAKIVTETGEVLASYRPYLPPLPWPLTVGKTWSGRYAGYSVAQGASWDAESKCAVKAIEPLSIAGRQVWTYHYDCVDDWWSGILSGSAYSSGWYSPEAKMVVKATLSGNPSADWRIIRFATH